SADVRAGQNEVWRQRRRGNGKNYADYRGRNHDTVARRNPRDEAGTNGKARGFRQARASERVRVEGGGEALPGVAASAGLRDEFCELDGRVRDGVFRVIRNREPGVSSIFVGNFASGCERNFRLDHFCESFPSRVGDPFRSGGGQERKGVALTSPNEEISLTGNLC